MARHTIRRTAPALIAAFAALTLTASAAFAEGMFSVGIEGGPGKVSGDPGIDCIRNAGAPVPVGTCSAFVEDEVECRPDKPICTIFPARAFVTATAVAGAGFGFDHWTGACFGTSPACSTLVPADRTATAVFVDTQPPSVGLTATVSGKLPLRADAGDNAGVTRVEFRMRGVLRRTDTSAPFTWTFDTTTVADGPAEITATAFDAAGNLNATTQNVRIDN